MVTDINTVSTLETTLVSRLPGPPLFLPEQPSCCRWKTLMARKLGVERQVVPFGCFPTKLIRRVSRSPSEQAATRLACLLLSLRP